jgi:hypothetical protein
MKRLMNTKKMNQMGTIILLTLGMIFSLNGQAGTPEKKEEGMYPLSLLSGLDLKAAGLEIPLNELYNPNGVSLIDALVRLGGCTGSFVSENGLIITNHHCVFGSVASISTAEKNYLEEGFHADTEGQEIKTGLTVRITQSYEDVSDAVLEGINSSTSPEKRVAIIRKHIDSIEKAQQELYPDFTVEISEMFVGKFYTLFRYKTLNDIRLVYVPPRTVGEFGGETDNWVWPRHNADFSFVRAYEDGKPYRPKKHLKIDTDGVKENDFAFILGYPGRTYRHQPAEYLQYQNDHLLPFIADWYDFKISTFEKAGEDDQNMALRYASVIKRHANVTKNFKGKMQGLRRTTILESKYAEQKALKKFMAGDQKLLERYSTLFSELEALYDKQSKNARKELILGQMFRSSGVMFASAYSRYMREQMSEVEMKMSEWLETETANGYLKSFKSNYTVYSEVIDRAFAEWLVHELLELNDPEANALLSSHGINNKADVEMWFDKKFAKSRFLNVEGIKAWLDNKPAKLIKAKDKTQGLAYDLFNWYLKLSKDASDRTNRINALLPDLADLKLAYYKNTFVPDANGTLRFTYGYVKGYSPEDAVYNRPFTTIKGILEKATETGDYALSEEYREILRNTQAPDNLKLKKDGDVVVGMLYNMDTTGGNSGSPIMNSKGELIGVNFDRAYTATINDFAWNESYSRSIGVDIRYVLFVLKYIGSADNVLSELKAGI